MCMELALVTGTGAERISSIIRSYHHIMLAIGGMIGGSRRIAIDFSCGLFSRLLTNPNPIA